MLGIQVFNKRILYILLNNLLISFVVIILLNNQDFTDNLHKKITMNLEIEQQQKFAEQFSKLIENAPKKFKDKWDGEIKFIRPAQTKIIPAFNSNLIDILPAQYRTQFEILRNKYYSKTL